MTQIVVTGVAGFIGSSLSEKLLEQNYDVLGIDSITDYYPNKIKEKNLEICLQKSNFTFLQKVIACSLVWRRFILLRIRLFPD